MRTIWQYLKTRLVVKTQERWVEARLLNIPQCTGWPIPQCTTKDSLAPMSAVPKLRSPDVEKTQGSQATAASHEWVKGKNPIVSMAFCFSSSIAGHLAPTWKLLGLPAARGERADPLQATETSNGCQPQW